MVRQLVSLHESSAHPYKLPREGIVTIGRRLENHIICRDISVSGRHCLVKIGLNSLEVVDCSSNGTFVNDHKLQKGQRQQIGDGDVISLMKPLMGEEETTAPLCRVQFRLEIRPGDSPPDIEQEEANAQGTSPERLPPTPVQRCTTNKEGFAHDLLVQEQQSKAKITGELLLARRRLDEERTRSEALTKELRKARSALDEERSRRSVAQEARDRLVAEAGQLRADRRQLQELRSTHETLRDQHDSTEVEVTAQVQRAASLEAAQERSRGELERAKASAAQMAQQLEELQTRLQRAQASSDKLEQEHSQARAAAEAALQEAERLQRDLCSERAAREQLEDQQALLRGEAERAQQGERAARDLLETSMEQQRDLEARAARSRNEAETARASAHEGQVRHEAESTRLESLRSAAGRLAEGFRVFFDRWASSLFESSGGEAWPSAAPATVEEQDACCTQRTPAADDSDEETVPTAAVEDEAGGAPQSPTWCIELLGHTRPPSPMEEAQQSPELGGVQEGEQPQHTKRRRLGAKVSGLAQADAHLKALEGR